MSAPGFQTFIPPTSCNIVKCRWNYGYTAKSSLKYESTDCLIFFSAPFVDVTTLSSLMTSDDASNITMSRNWFETRSDKDEIIPAIPDGYFPSPIQINMNYEFHLKVFIGRLLLSDTLNFTNFTQSFYRKIIIIGYLKFSPPSDTSCSSLAGRDMT